MLLCTILSICGKAQAHLYFCVIVLSIIQFQPSTTSNDHYKLSICTPLTGGDCDGAAVCNNKDKLGLASTAQYRKHGDSVIVTYSGGMGCRLDGKSRSMIHLKPPLPLREMCAY